MTEIIGTFILTWFQVTILAIPFVVMQSGKAVELMGGDLALICVPVVILLGPASALLYWGWAFFAALFEADMFHIFTAFGALGVFIYAGGRALNTASALGAKLDAALRVPAFRRLDQVLTVIGIAGLASAAYSTAKAIKNRRD